MDQLLIRVSAAALCNIRRNRYGCPANLARQAIDFLFWKMATHLINEFDQTPAIFPDIQFFKVVLHASIVSDMLYGQTSDDQTGDKRRRHSDLCQRSGLTSVSAAV